MCTAQLGERLGAKAEQRGAARHPRPWLERSWWLGPANPQGPLLMPLVVRAHQRTDATKDALCALCTSEEALGVRTGLDPYIKHWRCCFASGELEEGAAPTMMQDTMKKILGAIEDIKLTLRQEIRKVSSELNHLRTYHHKLANREEATETSLEELQPAHRALRAQVTCLSERNQVLERRAEDVEGCSRRNNKQIVGMPEGIEGTDTVAYLETWLRTIMNERPLTPWRESTESRLVGQSREDRPTDSSKASTLSRP
ncbi:hypothetical protein NDU88_008707 [Pleurodeles waltl]|uniref:Uncharacterized protein n=1 Tax=Pleurodeles waltl TaxID=8319 RepID=A0AAV7QPE7_PLEWA|nr:hypothetical protein NDU88_008707 [Pleurodeles waltl]